MKILFFTDPHNCDTPPRMRKASYTKDILDKQEQLIKHAQECDLVICGGDIFHQKKPHQISYWLTNQILEIYRQLGHLIIIPGNHDFDLAMDEIWSKSPMVLFSTLPNAQILHDKTLVFDEFILYGFGGGDFVPHSELLIRVQNFDKYYGDTRKKAKLGAFHSSIVGGGHKKYPFDIIPALRLLHSFDSLCVGHLHDITNTSLSFIAPGSLSRGTLKLDSDLYREVGYAVFEIGVSGVFDSKFVRLDVKSPEEIFYVDKKLADNEIKKASGKLIEFIDSLDVPKAMGKDDLIEYIEEMEDIDTTVREAAIRVLRGL